jgi:hypothetical protein
VNPHLHDVMDTFEPSFDPDCCRHRSVRRRKRHIQTDREKQLIRLRKELRILWRQRRAIEPVPLEKPYQDGWVRCYMLSEEMKRHPHAALFEGVLKHINTYEYCKHRQFLVKKGKKNRKANYLRVPQQLKSIGEAQFHDPKLNLSPAEKVLFVPVEKWHSGYRRMRIRYVFADPWKFRLIVRPYMVTERFPINSELESRIQAIEDYFEQNNIPLWVSSSKCDRITNYHSTGRNFNELKYMTLRAIAAMYETEKPEKWEI